MSRGSGLSFNPVVAVEDNLYVERGMRADNDTLYASQPRLPVNVQPRKTRYRPAAFPSRVGISAHWIPLKSFRLLLL